MSSKQGSQNLLCPRCLTALAPDRIEEALTTVDALRCPDCEGRFFRQGRLEEIDDIVAPRLIEIRRIPSPSEQYVDMKCPACSPPRVMNKYEHERDQKVILDVCPECKGVWLDGGELEAIQHEALPVFIANTIRYFREIFKDS